MTLIATRAVTHQQKESLKRRLREMCGNGQLVPGHPVPSERELAAQFNLSRPLVAQTLTELISEGLLYSVPRLGTFVGRPPDAAFEFYLLVLRRQPRDGDLLSYLQTGFEQRIAQLGGTSLMMLLETALEHYERGELPPLAGVFEPNNREGLGSEGGDWRADEQIAAARFAGLNTEWERADVVKFDNVGGGRQATAHLLGLGHRRIAFLGMHSPQNPVWCGWSSEREQGWHEAMEAAGHEVRGLAFQPEHEPPLPEGLKIAAQMEWMERVAQPLLGRRDISAVVAANDASAMALLEALRKADIAPAHWPAIVGFDNLSLTSGHVLTSMRLPWEEIGRTAADLLWERRHGRINGAPQERRIAMSLIPRLTCRSDWSLNPGHSALTHLVAPNSLLERASTLPA